MTREEAIANLEMISIAFVEPVTKEQKKLIDDTFNMAIKALEQEPLEVEAAKLQKAYNKGCEDCIQAVKYVNMYIKGGKDNDLYSVK